MSLRTGMLRLGTVIRGTGWLIAAGIGISAAIALTGDIRDTDSKVAKAEAGNVFDQFDKPIANDGPWKNYQTPEKPGGWASAPIIGKSAAEIQAEVAEVRTSALKRRFWSGVAFLLGAVLAVAISYLVAWVFVGFAPER